MEKIKLFMNYSLNKTLSENILEQENIKTKSDLMYQEWEKEQSAEKEKEKEKNKTAWKERCRYPEKALLPPKNNAGVEGKDALIDGFCYYPTPNKDGGISGIYIPEDSEISWWTVEKISYAVDQHLEKYPEEDRKTSISNFSKIFPLGTVFAFKVGNSTYTTWITLKDGFWEFKYFYNIVDRKPYEQPTWVDERTKYQKFVDEYGFAIQITAALATAIAGMMTGGVAWVLYAEIALEGGLGLAVGLREMEKGENVSATLSFITGILPMLKLSKVFTGIPEKEFIELSKELKNAGLTATSDVSKYVEFYNGLSPDKQKIMSKLLKQDDYFKEKLLKSLNDELPKIVNDGLKKMVKENPELLKSIPFFERLWARELGTNSFFVILGILVNVVWGDILNAQDLEKLKGVYSVVPENLKKEMAFNLISNVEILPKLTKTESFKSIEKFTNLEKKSNSWSVVMGKWFNTYLKDSIQEAGGTYTELSENNDIAVPNKVGNKRDEKELRKLGFIPMTELTDTQDIYDYTRLNSVDWFKIKK